MKRNTIHIIARHSNITEEELAITLQKNVYNDQESWKKFFRLFFLSLGVGFTVSGIIFFFAYNWADLHKFVKIGLAQGVLIATTGLIFLPKISAKTKNIILTGAAFLVGVLFAVFGQIYQTGANAYDFFLGWTVFITLWVIVSNFSPLWLLYLVLINTTIVLYAQQVAKDWSTIFMHTVLFSINLVALVIILLIKKNTSKWLSNLVALVAASFATFGVCIGIIDDYGTVFYILSLLTLIAFTLGFRYALQIKRSSFLAMISFSLITIVSAFFIELMNDEAVFLLLCIFIMGSVTFTIKKLIAIQKKWADEK